MASLSCTHDGRWLIRFMVTTDGGVKSQRTIGVGRGTREQGERVLQHVEEIILARHRGVLPSRATQLWLATISDDFRGKLANVGLVEHSQPVDPAPPRVTLGPFVEEFIRMRPGVKASTRITYGNAKRNLIEFFGADRPLDSITAGDADDWQAALRGDGLADATICRRTRQAKSIFRNAVRKRLLSVNPFEDLRSGSKANKARQRFITRAEIELVIAQAVDPEWKLIIALARYGGLRVPSEIVALRWEHVDWEHNRVTVPSPKTAHHQGHESRVIPLFPELQPHLQRVFDDAEEGETRVITRYRQSTQNLGTQFARIIRSAGLTPWPKLFTNLRSTRETELAREHPEHVVAKWIGNSVPVAREHYLQVTDDDFTRATQRAGTERALKALCAEGASTRTEAVQNGVCTLPQPCA
jgi:integrase